MAHINDQVRDAVVAAVTGLPTTGARVDADFLSSRHIAEPRLVVRVTTDKVDTDFSNQQERILRVAVSGYAKDTSAAGVLGNIQSEVEAALESAGTFSGLLPEHLKLQGDDRDIEPEALEKAAGVVTLIYGVRCFTRAGQPEVAV